MARFPTLGRIELHRARRRRAVATTLLLLAVVRAAGAAGPLPAVSPETPTGEGLANLHQILQSIATQSPDVLAAAAAAEQAHSKMDGARAAWFGTVDTYALSQHFNDPRLTRPITLPPTVSEYPFARNQFGYGVEASIPIDLSGRIAANVAAARSTATSARWRADDVRLQVLLRGATLYRSLQALSGQHDALEKQISALRASERAAQVGLEAGQIAKVSLLRVKAAVADMQAQLALVEGRTHKLLAELNALTNARVSPGAITVPRYRPCSLPTGAGDLPPALEMVQGKVDAAQAAVLSARRNQYPQLAVVGNWNHNSIQWDSRSVDTWQVNLVLRFNLWAGGAQRSAVDSARAAEMEARQVRKSAEDSLLAAREGARANWNAQERSWRAAESGLTHATESARIERSRFRNGLGSATDLIDAEAALARARAGVATALAGWWQADAALRYTYGNPPAALGQDDSSCVPEAGTAPGSDAGPTSQMP